MNLKKLILLLLSGSLLFVKCDSPNSPINNEDIVPQIDISWPSLGNTQWPMHHHDPQSTGRSKYSGPQLGVLAKKVHTWISESGISIGYNKAVFLSSSYPPGYFFALDYEGNTKWNSWFSSYTTPLISSDSIIYAAGEKVFFAFTHSGDTLWKNTLDEKNRIVSVGINIDKGGNLYYIDYNHTLTVLDKNGNLKWKLYDERFLNWTDAEPTIDYNGNIYFGTDTLYSLTNGGKLRWKQSLYGRRIISPLICDKENVVYIGTENPEILENKIIAVSDNGETKWEIIDAVERELGVSPALTEDGTLFYPTWDNEKGNYLVIK